MDNETSNSAIAAIAALQNRIKLLEEENNNFQKEKLKLETKINCKNKFFFYKNKAMENASEKAKEILSYISSTILEVQKEKEKNNFIRNQIKEIELLIPNKLENLNQKKKIKKEFLKNFNYYLNIINQYDLILFEIFKPIEFCQYEEINSNISINLNYFDSDIQNLLKKLIKLPKNFIKQSLFKKKKILYYLKESKIKLKLIEYQINQIYDLNKFNEELKKLNLQYFIIINELNKFIFL